MAYYGKFRKRGVRRPIGASSRRAIKKVAKKGASKALRANFNRRVKAVIDRVSETKCLNYSIQNKQLFNVASADWISSVVNLLPEATGGSTWQYSCNQGTGESDRIGNEIRPTGLYLTGVLRANLAFDNTTNYNPCPLRVTMWLVRIKKHLTDSSTNLEQIVDNTFFNAGNTSSGMFGTTLDLTRTPNPDQITVVMKKTFLLGASDYVSGFAVNSGNNVSQRYADNGTTISRMFRIDLTKYLPKKLIFNDGGNTTPVNARKMWLMISTQRVDGSISQTLLGNYTGPIPAYIDYGLDFKYKDV